MAKPTGFRESCLVLQPNSSASYSENIGKVAGLPIWTDGEQCVSRWKLGFIERLCVLFTGKVWVSVLSGSAQPPIAVSGAVSYFKHAE